VDIPAWLRSLGLERYEDAFRANAIDADVLPDLTDADLEKLGVILGDRKRLLKTSAALRWPSTDCEAGGPAPHDGARERDYPAELAAERRQLTIVFVDLVGSTTLSAKLDPEEMCEVLRSYRNTAADAIARFEGHTARFLGDGVLAYFGWPQAHEDAAERAVRATLATVDAVGRLATPDGTKLAARGGIATGLVVVGELIGEGTSREEAAVGETPNLAARLQQLAEPGAVVVAEATQRLLGHLFEFDDLGLCTIKGFENSVRAFRVCGEGRIQSRFEAHQVTPLSTMIGRNQELALLLKRWRQAETGEGQGVLLIGEAGIGKSRLVRALADTMTDAAYVMLCYQCSPYHAHTPLWPVIQQLGFAAGFAFGDDVPTRFAKFEAVLTQGGVSYETTMLLAHIVGIDVPETPALAELMPQQRRMRSLAALVNYLAGLAARMPVLMLFEDIHWIDPTSLEFLKRVIDRIADLQVFLLLTSRPEGQPNFGEYPYLTRLRLNRLGRASSTAIVGQLTRGKPLPAAVEADILARTDGVPLFVEELTKSVLESGSMRETASAWILDRALPAAAIPNSLHDSLMVRLDRLGPAKEVAQVAACIGREFDYQLLAAVIGAGELELERTLGELIQAELVFPHGTPPEAHYLFKHALVRDAAYASLLKAKRQDLHRRIITVLESDRPETPPEIMAQHAVAARLTEKAVGYCARAGQRALDRSANAEAVGHLTRGLALLEQLPEGDGRRKTEAELQLSLGDALRSAKRYGHDMERAYSRARQLCEQLGEIFQLIQVVYGQFVIAFNRPKIPAAAKAAGELLRIAQEHESAAATVLGHYARGATCFAQGNMAEACVHLQRALASPRRMQQRINLTHTQYPALPLTYLSWTLFVLGFADQAKDRCNEALAEAGQAPVLTLALTLDNALCLDQFRQDEQAVREHADALSSLAKKWEIPFYLDAAKFSYGWALAHRDQIREGIALMSDGLNAIWAAGMKVQGPYQLAQLAEGYKRMNDTPTGLHYLGEALARAEETGERWYEAELYRLKGDLLTVEDPAEAEACYRRAIKVAMEQATKMWELRAAVSLARLWRDQGRCTEARNLLASVFGWFSEGFDTVDLKQAKALLEQLSLEPQKSRR
jgi:predicted ATPase/class 3 adenylate cyclase